MVTPLGPTPPPLPGGGGEEPETWSGFGIPVEDEISSFTSAGSASRLDPLFRIPIPEWSLDIFEIKNNFEKFIQEFLVFNRLHDREVSLMLVARAQELTEVRKAIDTIAEDQAALVKKQNEEIDAYNTSSERETYNSGRSLDSSTISNVNAAIVDLETETDNLNTLNALLDAELAKPVEDQDPLAIASYTIAIINTQAAINSANTIINNYNNTYRPNRNAERTALNDEVDDYNDLVSGNEVQAAAIDAEREELGLPPLERQQTATTVPLLPAASPPALISTAGLFPLQPEIPPIESPISLNKSSEFATYNAGVSIDLTRLNEVNAAIAAEDENAIVDYNLYADARNEQIDAFNKKIEEYNNRVDTDAGEVEIPLVPNLPSVNLASPQTIDIAGLGLAETYAEVPELAADKTVEAQADALFSDILEGFLGGTEFLLALREIDAIFSDATANLLIELDITLPRVFVEPEEEVFLQGSGGSGSGVGLTQTVVSPNSQNMEGILSGEFFEAALVKSRKPLSYDDLRVIKRFIAQILGALSFASAAPAIGLLGKDLAKTDPSSPATAIAQATGFAGRVTDFLSQPETKESLTTAFPRDTKGAEPVVTLALLKDPLIALAKALNAPGLIPTILSTIEGVSPEQLGALSSAALGVQDILSDPTRVFLLKKELFNLGVTKNPTIVNNIINQTLATGNIQTLKQFEQSLAKALAAAGFSSGEIASFTAAAFDFVNTEIRVPTLNQPLSLGKVNKELLGASLGAELFLQGDSITLNERTFKGALTLSLNPALATGEVLSEKLVSLGSSFITPEVATKIISGPPTLDSLTSMQDFRTTLEARLLAEGVPRAEAEALAYQTTQDLIKAHIVDDVIKSIDVQKATLARELHAEVRKELEARGFDKADAAATADQSTEFLQEGAIREQQIEAEAIDRSALEHSLTQALVDRDVAKADRIAKDAVKEQLKQDAIARSETIDQWKKAGIVRKEKIRSELIERFAKNKLLNRRLAEEIVSLAIIQEKVGDGNVLKSAGATKGIELDAIEREVKGQVLSITASELSEEQAGVVAGEAASHVLAIAGQLQSALKALGASAVEKYVEGYREQFKTLTSAATRARMKPQKALFERIATSITEGYAPPQVDAPSGSMRRHLDFNV